METPKTLCDSCENKLNIEFLELPFMFNKRTGEQIKGNELIKYNCQCIYFNSNREGALDRMVIIKCDQYKSK